MWHLHVHEISELLNVEPPSRLPAAPRPTRLTQRGNGEELKGPAGNYTLLQDAGSAFVHRRMQVHKILRAQANF